MAIINQSKEIARHTIPSSVRAAVTAASGTITPRQAGKLYELTENDANGQITWRSLRLHEGRQRDSESTCQQISVR